MKPRPNRTEAETRAHNVYAEIDAVGQNLLNDIHTSERHKSIIRVGIEGARQAAEAASAIIDHYLAEKLRTDKVRRAAQNKPTSKEKCRHCNTATFYTCRFCDTIQNQREEKLRTDKTRCTTQNKRTEDIELLKEQHN